MSNLTDVVNRYYLLVGSFVTDPAEYSGVLHPEMQQREFPNLLNKQGQERALQGCLQGMLLGKQLLSRQEFTITNDVESQDQVVVEAIWTGTMAIDAGLLHRGQVLKAYICAVFQFKDGLIYRQRSYDCYEPIEP